MLLVYKVDYGKVRLPEQRLNAHPETVQGYARSITDIGSQLNEILFDWSNAGSI